MRPAAEAAGGPSASLHHRMLTGPPFWLQELTAVRMESHKAQTALMQRDAELERRNVEIASLQSDKAGLDKLLQVGCGGCGFHCLATACETAVACRLC